MHTVVYNNMFSNAWSKSHSKKNKENGSSFLFHNMLPYIFLYTNNIHIVSGNRHLGSPLPHNKVFAQVKPPVKRRCIPL